MKGMPLIFLSDIMGTDGTGKCSHGNEYGAEFFPYCHRSHGDLIWRRLAPG